MKGALAALAVLTIVVLGCGDAVIIIRVNTGTITSAPVCDNGMGRFDLQNQGGLVLLVLLDSNTAILKADGRPGHCTDLSVGAHVQVRGPQQGGQITARSVTLQ